MNVLLVEIDQLLAAVFVDCSDFHDLFLDCAVLPFWLLLLWPCRVAVLLGDNREHLRQVLLNCFEERIVSHLLLPLQLPLPLRLLPLIVVIADTVVVTDTIVTVAETVVTVAETVVVAVLQRGKGLFAGKLSGLAFYSGLSLDQGPGDYFQLQPLKQSQQLLSHRFVGRHHQIRMPLKCLNHGIGHRPPQ